MAIQPQTLRKQFRDGALFAIISLVQTYFGCSACIGTRVFLIVSGFTFLMWMFLWKGNSFVTHLVSARISWIEFPIKRLLVGIMVTTAYTLFAIFALIAFFENVFDFHFGDQLNMTVYSSVGLTIFISLILHSRSFLLSWKETKIESERYQKESIAARYESLKNQVNPHFLFNSLNALTNLVYEDQDKAVKFIKQLSEVYRYVLDTRERELVSLSEEVAFLTSYIYLQQIRFGEKLQVHLKIDAEGMVAPLALQMLIENAIKHNIVSEDDPLTIRIYTDEGYLVVENNLQKKLISAEPSVGIGLENICNRYKFLSNKQVEVTEASNIFKVRLPLIIEKIL
jgi:sensor histidine kinase YesM